MSSKIHVTYTNVHPHVFYDKHLYGILFEVYILNKEPGTGLVSSVRRALTSKLRGPGFKSRPVTVGGPVTIIMWGARLGWKLALS